MGYPLREAKSRLWELGLNVGQVSFDEGVDLLHRKDARVYFQSPSAERSAVLGSKVELRLSLEESKINNARSEAERQARTTAEVRIREEEDRREESAADSDPQTEQPAHPNDNFFD